MWQGNARLLRIGRDLCCSNLGADVGCHYISKSRIRQFLKFRMHRYG